MCEAKEATIMRPFDLSKTSFSVSPTILSEGT
jgi:hypothetical protein